MLMCWTLYASARMDFITYPDKEIGSMLELLFWTKKHKQEPKMLQFEQTLSHLISVSDTFPCVTPVATQLSLWLQQVLLSRFFCFFSKTHMFFSPPNPFYLTFVSFYSLPSLSPFLLPLSLLSSLSPSLPSQSPASPSVPPVRAAKIKWCHFSMTL